MKKTLSILLLLFVTLVCFNGCSDAEEASAETIHTKACTIEISGMMCEKGCKTTIQNRINDMSGVVNGEVDYALGKAFITYDANTLSCADIIAEIQSIGDGLYDAKIVEDKDIENAPVHLEEDAQNGSASVSNFSFEVPDISWVFSDLL
ncbi:heavy-metal-associated domain-containing protein [Parvicella tangerina]|nr:heavy metal-associated domain-containing protein [Parvicella tangerina]